MPPEVIRFARDGQARRVGMGDFVLVSPDRMQCVGLSYVGEPPLGNSYYRVTADGAVFLGEV